MEGITKPIDMVRLAVSRLKWYAFTWWYEQANCGGDYQLRTLVWSDFKLELVNALMDVDHELRLYHQFNALKQQKSISQYTKQFRQLVLELGDQALDDGVLLFMLVVGLKVDVKIYVLLA